MNRKNLTTAVIAGIAGVAGIANMANAVYLNPDGVGQVLLYPYYTVNGGQQTLLSVVNTTAIGKVVKVRFLEGYNSREVLDFNLYLSRFDVWTANVFALRDAGINSDFAGIFTTDNSCTDPPLTASGNITVGGAAHGYQQFLNFKYVGSQNADTGPVTDDRTREGHFEMITMGDILEGSALETDITHVQPSGIPPACGSAKAASTAVNILAPGARPNNLDNTALADGLYGSAAVVNVGAGTFYAYNADAIGAFSQQQLYTSAGSLTPSLQQVNEGPAATVSSYVFSNNTVTPFSGLVKATYPHPGTPGTGPSAIDAVSALFEAQNVYNQYESAGTAVGTDWVVTMPTKRFYVDAQPGGALPTTSTAPGAPFEELFGSVTDGESCVTVGNGTTIYNREEGHTGSVTCPISPCPGNAPNSQICLETNVIRFQTDSILASGLTAQTITPFGTAGWVNLDLSGFGHLMYPSVETNVFAGIPVTGFEATNFTNGSLSVGGVNTLANYSGVYRHRLFRNCTAGPCS